MELTLAQNIRSYRKQRKMTQEQLSEVLGVTVGAVHKWESGLSVPELPMIVEMADFFDVSVDVLLGHRMKDNSVQSICERLYEYCRTLDPVALSEAEKALGKYPHSFRIVLDCAKVYLVFGTGNHDRKQLERALELLKQSRVLLPQNNDPRIGDVTICGAMATVLFLLGKTDECLDLLKKNNAGGLFNDHIGMTLATFMNRNEEASGYLAEALTDGVSTLLTTVIGYVFVFRSREDWKSALDILEWGMRILEGLMTDRKAGALIKTHAQMFALLSYVQEKAGKVEESEHSLREAFRLAAGFDSTPDFSLSEMRFADNTERMLVFDIFGASAKDGIDGIIGLLGDKAFAARWKRMTENGR
ncbi:MAG: helix-turn-helix domain-containing protein [bacterium]|nr:helix-turn-helix domain-containing protein [bacterium]